MSFKPQSSGVPEVFRSLDRHQITVVSCFNEQLRGCSDSRPSSSGHRSPGHCNHTQRERVVTERDIVKTEGNGGEERERCGGQGEIGREGDSK